MREDRERATQQARHLRQTMTASEVRLWQGLRGRRLDGFRFRRQHPLGRYIVDFACLSARLVVEVDGPSHDDAEQVLYDAARTDWLVAQGWTVLRVKNEFVFQRLDRVLADIQRALADAPHRPVAVLRSTSPALQGTIIDA
ncbi:endonuclease domain-containing protein [uncultured Maricaulis sp.]|uniref:endonuclease domain-containing protein n=1 Tax=uncultured Maricaulis sp. TaxID=174710 RepID=UPI0030DB574B